jgi:hypothetical protein
MNHQALLKTRGWPRIEESTGNSPVRFSSKLAAQVLLHFIDGARAIHDND